MDCKFKKKMVKIFQIFALSFREITKISLRLVLVLINPLMSLSLKSGLTFEISQKWSIFIFQFLVLLHGIDIQISAAFRSFGGEWRTKLQRIIEVPYKLTNTRF